MIIDLIPVEYRIMSAIIGIAVAAGGGAVLAWKVQAWRYGETIADMKAEASLAQAISVNQARAKERQNAAHNDKVESSLLKSQSKNRRLAADNRRLANQLGGLRDPGANSTACVPGPAQGSTDTKTTPGTTGRLLSKEASDFLLEFAEQCDAALSYAWACHNWANGLK